jgi:hypothetical protein
MASFLDTPGTSTSVPKFEFVKTVKTLAVPAMLKLPLASGVPETARTRTFVHTNPQVMPLALLLVTVKTNCVVVAELMGTAVPLVTPLILLALEPLPLSRFIMMPGAVPVVSKINPVGALSIIVPAPTFPLAFSE